jgi:hypothetical protein
LAAACRTPAYLDPCLRRGDEGKGHAKGTRQKKWGRHCCRPHSYRRVVFREEELDAWRFPASRGQAPQSQLCRPALAPASVPSCFGKSVPKNFIIAAWRNRDRTFVGGFPLPRLRNRGLAFASTSSRKIRPLRLRSHPDPSVTLRVHPKTFAGRVFSRPGGFHRRIESGSKISSFFRVLPRPSEEPIPALDDLMLPLFTESRKAASRDLSTVRRFTCG